MSDNKVYKMCVTALLTALTCVATMVIHVPTPVTNGYVNVGDVVVLLSGWLLGPAWGFFAGGVGSALADLLSGYMTYVPGTLIIKGLMAVVAWYVAKAAKEGGVVSFIVRLIAGIAAEAVMVLGYFAYESTALGYGLAAAGSILANVAQGIMGIIGGLILYYALSRTGIAKKVAPAKA